MELADHSHWGKFSMFPSFHKVHRKSLLFFFSGFLYYLGSNYFLILTLYGKQGKKKRNLFWVPAIAPLLSVVISTFFVFITRADKQGVQTVSTSILFQ